ncbi:hypothetical protein [Acinetobacter sp. NigerLNRRAM0016]
MKNLSHVQKEVEMLSRNKLLPPLKVEGCAKNKPAKSSKSGHDLKNIDLYSGGYIQLKD